MLKMCDDQIGNFMFCNFSAKYSSYKCFYHICGLFAGEIKQTISIFGEGCKL